MFDSPDDIYNYVPDVDALYEERTEWQDHWYDDIDRDSGSYFYDEESDDEDSCGL